MRESVSCMAPDIVPPPPSVFQVSSDDSPESRCLELLLKRPLIQKRIQERGSYVRGVITSIVSRSPDGGPAKDPSVIAIVDFICRELERRGLVIRASFGKLALSDEERKARSRVSHRKNREANKRKHLEWLTRTDRLHGNPGHRTGTDDAAHVYGVCLGDSDHSFDGGTCRRSVANGIDPIRPIVARPGSEEKILVLSARYSAGLPLWHDRDESPDEDHPGLGYWESGSAPDLESPEAGNGLEEDSDDDPEDVDMAAQGSILPM